MQRTAHFIIAVSIMAAISVSLPVSATEREGDPLVREIQLDLRKLGYEMPVIDGLYGPMTRKAIEAFQEDRNLDVIGKATPRLRDRLEQILFKSSKRAQRLWRQSRLFLKALGYAPGDGEMSSPAAKRALAAFGQTYWLDESRAFSPTFAHLIRRRVLAEPAAHVWLCDHYMADGAYSLALGWCRRAAKREEPRSQYYMGWMAFYGRGRPSSDADAFRWFQAAAGADHTRAQIYTGLMYRKGRGVGRDIDAAMHWYGRATADGK